MFVLICNVIIVHTLFIYAIQGHNIYEIVDLSMNNSGARSACKDIGMDLAVFPDVINYCQAKKFSKYYGNKTSAYWIGLYNYDSNFIWADGNTETWWEKGVIDVKKSRNCYILSAQRRKIEERHCTECTFSALCGKEGKVKVMKNLPNTVSTLRYSGHKLYIFHIKLDDPYAPNEPVSLNISSAYLDNPFGVSSGSIYIEKGASIIHDNYILEVTADYSCGAKETSYLCISVFDTTIDVSTTANPLCLLGQTGDEPLDFLIPANTLDKLCNELPLLDYNEPDKIIVAILYLQFTIDQKLFPYILKLLSRDKRDILDFVYGHCELYYPYPVLIKTEEQESDLQTTKQPSICLKIEKDTIKVPVEVTLGNHNLYLTTVDNLATACEIWPTSVQDDEPTFPDGGESIIPLQSSHESVEKFVLPDSGIICVSWTAVTTTVTIAGNDFESEVAEDPSQSLMQQGDAGAKADKEECGVFSCWSEPNQIGVIVVACIGVGVIAATSLLVYKNIGKNRVVPFTEPEINRPSREHSMADI